MKGKFVWYTAQKFLLVFAGTAMTFLVFSRRFYLYLHPKLKILTGISGVVLFSLAAASILIGDESDEAGPVRTFLWFAFLTCLFVFPPAIIGG